MYKKLLNEMHLTLIIQPLTPLLIKSSQDTGANPLLPSMSFVRSPHPVMGDQTAYIPGSSLKGVIRSRAEQYIRTLSLNINEFNDAQVHKQVDKAILKQNFYRVVCSATRMFGSTSLAGRVRFPDFYPDNVLDILPIRQMVAIDRRSGASANTFTMEVVPPVVDQKRVFFTGTIHLQNFERWQVGLLAMVIRDLNAGAVTLGFGSGRGLGRVSVSYAHMALSYPGMLDTREDPRVYNHILGLGQLALASDTDKYGFHTMESIAPSYALADEHLHVEFGRVTLNSDFWNLEQSKSHTVIEDMLKPLVGDWAHYVQWQRDLESASP